MILLYTLYRKVKSRVKLKGPVGRAPAHGRRERRRRGTWTCRERDTVYGEYEWDEGQERGEREEAEAGCVAAISMD